MEGEALRSALPSVAQLSVDAEVEEQVGLVEDEVAVIAPAQVGRHAPVEGRERAVEERAAGETMHVGYCVPGCGSLISS